MGYRMSMLETNKTVQIVNRFVKYIDILTHYLSQRVGKKMKKKCPLSMKKKQVLLATLECRKLNEQTIKEYLLPIKIFKFISSYENCGSESLKAKCKVEYIRLRSFMNL